MNSETSKKKITLGELATYLQATLSGQPDIQITGIATLSSAKPGQITFLDNPLYKKYLENTNASAVITSAHYAPSSPVYTLVVESPYFAYAKISSLFSNAPLIKSGIHPSAIVDETAEVDPTASIGAKCVIGAHVVISKNAVIGAGCVIEQNTFIGEDTRLWPNVTLYYDVKIGKRNIIHSGVVIGSDGFGFAKDKGCWHKIHQNGRVVIGDDVEIGANTTIDRGALEDTVIENGVKLDNQIQIGHNVQIGEHTAIAGCTGVSGSTKIGKHCMIGGASLIAGHLEIGENVTLYGGTGVSKSLLKPGIYASAMLTQERKEWLRNQARLQQLDKLVKRVKALEIGCVEERKGSNHE